MKKTTILTMICIIACIMSFETTGQSCSDCTDFTQQSGLNSSNRNNLAKQFAPQMRFERGARTFPMSAQVIFDNSRNTACDPNLRLGENLGDAHFDADFHEVKNKIMTYYNVQRSGNRYFIAYWWTYWRQPNCYGSSGGHDYDWEHIMVQVERSGNSYQGVSVTFFQHSGWYTKLYEEGRMAFADGHPVVYVGKKSHGSYHKGGDCAANECCYFGDCRNSNPNHYFNVWSENGLWEMNCNNQALAYPGRWGSTGRGPLYKQRSWTSLAGCSGDARTCLGGQQGCNWSNVSSNVSITNIAQPNTRTATLNSEWLKDIDSDEAMFGDSDSSCNCRAASLNQVTDVLEIDQNISPDEKLMIMDYQGKVLIETEGTNSINVQNLTSGVYLLNIGGKQTIKFVKQ